MFVPSSGGDVPGVGNQTVHRGQKGSVGIQWESLHFHGHIQRIPSFGVSQRVNVSIMIRTENSNGNLYLYYHVLVHM